jgi:transcription initiation factor TFIIIB Brf1 subunit/transcription initiation factor TFIIB
MTFVLECPNCGSVDFIDDEGCEQFTCTDCGKQIPYADLHECLSSD